MAAKKKTKKTASKKKTAKKVTKKATASKGSAKKTAKKTAAKKTAAKKTAAKKTAAKKAPSAAKPKVAKKAAPAAARSSGKRQQADDKQTVAAIERTAERIHGTIIKRRIPQLQMPVRSLSNVRYSDKAGYFEIGKGKKTRTLSVNTVKTFAQTLKLMSLSKELVKTDDFATKRDAYYQSKNWGDARFKDQPESDTVMDDIEAMFSIDGVSREQLRFIPDQHGGAVAGALTVIDRDIETDEAIEIDCTRFGSGAYSIPSSVEHLKFKTRAKFVLCIETQGMFERLARNKYWQKANCILISMGGVPTRSCRRFVRLLSESAKMPVYAFTDCDPYGIANIYRTLKVGSGNAAHINQFFCVPQVTFLGLTPYDIEHFDLKKATHPLDKVDVKRANDAIKNDPFFQSHKKWRDAIKKLLKMEVRAEQQALSLHGLNFVIEDYLPYKLKNVGEFLP
jgi:DNA topoisomerase-6 subunit A